MKNTFLTGERVYLRGLEELDLNGNYIQWLNDEEVCKYNSHHIFPYGKQKALEYIKRVNFSNRFLVLAVVLKENDIHIGNIALQNINYINQNAEYAILFGEKDYLGKGYAKEASLLVLRHGFLELNLRRIYCGTSEENIPMQKLAGYLGMKTEGVRREALFKNGKFMNIVEFGILKDEFFQKFNTKV